MKNLIFVFACLLLAIPCRARTITVDDDGPADFNNIQAAINDANNGDTVVIADGTYTGTGNRDIDFLGKSITVHGATGDPNDCIIDCQGNSTSRHRGFNFVSGEDANSVLESITITNGYGPEEDLGTIGVFKSFVGGGIFCNHSNPTIRNCIISNNSTTHMGGGMYNHYSKTKIFNCIIINNTAGAGGGIGNYISGTPISNCTITNNSAGTGGGICNSWSGIESHLTSFKINNCTIRNNSASFGGGIANSDYSCPTINKCIITGNSAIYYGGGIYSNNDCNPLISNCIIQCNVGLYGGGIYNTYNIPVINNCTIVNNFADNIFGAEIFNSDSSNPIINNCIIWSGKSNPIYGPANIRYSNVFGEYPGLGNIDTDPCFIEPGYWADANDPNIIVEPNDPNAVWVDGDYHLKSQGWRWDTQRKVWTWDDVTSRCIDSGNPGSPLGDELLSIPADPNNIWGQNLRINMGAYGGTTEASMPPYDWSILGDLTNDGLVNLIDFVYQAVDWLNSTDQQPGDLNRDGLIYISDLALLVEDWLKQTTWHE